MLLFCISVSGQNIKEKIETKYGIKFEKGTIDFLVL